MFCSFSFCRTSTHPRFFLRGSCSFPLLSTNWSCSFPLHSANRSLNLKYVSTWRGYPSFLSHCSFADEDDRSGKMEGCRNIWRLCFFPDLCPPTLPNWLCFAYNPALKFVRWTHLSVCPMMFLSFLWSSLANDLNEIQATPWPNGNHGIYIVIFICVFCRQCLSFSFIWVRA